MFKNKAKLLKQELIQSFGKVKEGAYYFEHIDKYFRKNKQQNSYQTISDKTTADLDFEELFMVLDRTHSKVGQQYLYNQLRNPFLDEEKVKIREELIGLFMKDEVFRLKIQLQLRRLDNSEAYYISTLFQEKPIEPPKWHRYLKFLALIPIISFLLIPTSEVFVYVFVVAFVSNLAIHYKNKNDLFQYMSSISQLIILCNKAQIISKENEFQVLNPDIKQSLLALKKVKRKMSFFAAETKIDNEFAVLAFGFLELIKVPFLIEPILLFSVLKSLEDNRKSIEAIFDFIGEIDLAISVASLRTGLENYCIPTVLTADNEMMMKNVYHPLIPNSVTNNLVLDNRSVLLTGSNMSGKTSFIRTIGINTLTAFTINTCFAESFSLMPTRLFSAIRITDDLMNDKSYYFEEVLTIKEMINEANSAEANLFLLDEIFKGTNTVERIAAGKAVLSSLATGNNRVFVSTHDIELADLLIIEYELYHFSEIIEEGNVGFDYQLKPGKLKNRNAIKILEINDYPTPIIEEANALAVKLDAMTRLNKEE